MKRALAIILCLLLTTACFSAGAYDASPDYESQSTYTTTTTETETNDGVIIIDELTVESNTRSSSKRGTLTRTFVKNNNTIAVITLTATFSYNGSTVSVVSKSVTQSDTYNGWSFKQDSLASSGGTVTLTGRLTKILTSPVIVNMSITCDKNGNIT